MRDLNVMMRALLERVTGVELYETEADMIAPSLTIRPTINTPVQTCFGIEEKSRIVYEVVCLGRNAQEVNQLACKVGNLMSSKGFDRTSASCEGKLKFVMTFKGIIDNRTNLVYKE